MTEDHTVEMVARLRANADPRCYQHIRGLSADAADRIETQATTIARLRAERDAAVGVERERCARLAERYAADIRSKLGRGALLDQVTEGVIRVLQATSAAIRQTQGTDHAG